MEHEVSKISDGGYKLLHFVSTVLIGIADAFLTANLLRYYFQLLRNVGYANCVNCQVE